MVPDQEVWPLNRSLNYNTILQLDLFCQNSGMTLRSPTFRPSWPCHKTPNYDKLSHMPLQILPSKPDTDILQHPSFNLPRTPLNPLPSYHSPSYPDTLSPSHPRSGASYLNTLKPLKISCLSMRWPMEKRALFKFTSPCLCLTCHKSKLNWDLLVRTPPILFGNSEELAVAFDLT